MTETGDYQSPTQSLRPQLPSPSPVGEGAPRWLQRILFLCFLFSGMAALIYQVSWLKALGLIFGKTTYALTAVLAAFMAGLALGSWFLGRFAERGRDLLRLYGWMELGIGATGLGSLGGLWLMRQSYPLLFESVADHSLLLLAYRFLASFLLLLIPTTLMGGTYPVVVKYLARRSEQLGTLASRLYWLNTAGAIVGACLAGFVLLWHLGLLRTLLIAAGLNGVAAGLVWFGWRRLNRAAKGAGLESEPVEEHQTGASERGGGRLLLLVTAVSGLTAMMFEIGWTRLLAVFLSSTTYAFTLMLATFLLGITLGSYLFERWHRSWELTPNLLGQFLILLALGGALFLAIGSKLAELTHWLALATAGSGAALLGSQFLVSFLAMIVPTTLFGLIFPLTLVLYCGRDPRRGARTGLLYGVNTLGAILGASLTGLLFIQWLNTVNTLLLASGLNGAVALGLFLRGNPKRSWGRVGTGMGLLLLLGAAAHTQAFASPVLYGLSVVGNVYRQHFGRPLRVEEIARAEKQVYVEEGLNSTVVVARREGLVTLRTDGKTEASSLDQQTQLLLAYVPLALHPNPRRVLVIGFGSGASVYAATQFSQVERVDCVEIEPAVLRAAPHLQELNRGVDRHPKLRVILDDARNHLLVSRQRYDVIISEPAYLWSAGMASLFTREFYQQVRQHLEPDGLFVQWVQAYQLAPQDFRSVLRTLGTTFEQMSLWRGSDTDFLVVSSATPRRFRLENFRREYHSNPLLRADFARYLSVEEPFGLLGYYLLDDAAVRDLAAGADLNTDDRTVLEYRVPFSITEQTDELNQAVVRSLRRTALPSFLELDDLIGASLAGAETQVQLGMLTHPLGAALVPEAIARAGGSARGLWLQAAVAAHEGKQLSALTYLQQAERQHAGSAHIAYSLARVYLLQGEEEGARRWLARCLALSPHHPKALGAFVDLEARAGRWSRAIELQEQLIRSGPAELFAAWARLGELHRAAGQLQPALQAFQHSLELEPLGYVAHRHVAELLTRTGESAKAIEEYRFLVQYYPSHDPDLYLQLSKLYRETGQPREARRILEKAKRIFPTHPGVERALWSGSH